MCLLSFKYYGKKMYVESEKIYIFCKDNRNKHECLCILLLRIIIKCALQNKMSQLK